ncbi:MAG: RNA polymerase factor sigma-54 [Chloroflexota bacterium]|nr:RNA polymerase factor sigma-54 [Chloroflexota bacterium]
MAWMETGFELGQEMRPWVSPSLIEANYILSLSQMELQQVIAAEMDANPALEMEDRSTCPVCGGVLDGVVCSTCLTNQNGTQADHHQESFEDYPEQMITGVSNREEDPDFDPMALVASDMSVLDQILADARTVLDESEHFLCEYILDCLDERGFLVVSPEDIADHTNTSVEDVLAVLDVIQDVAPVGVGARSLQECLLLQAEYLYHSGHPIPEHVGQIIKSHLTQFGAHKYGQIAKELGLTIEQVEDARQFIRTHLNPFPLQATSAKSWRSPTDSTYVAPDVIISLRENELHVEIIDNKLFHLKMNPLYEELAAQVGRRRKANAHAKANGNANYSAEAVEFAGNASADDRQHVRQYSNRAKLFISNIHQRRDTLLRISQCICELQENFLRGGVRELQPLTRAVVAQQVGVHESTVSRATANKYVMLPNRKVIPFSDFFTPSLSVKDMIKELIERESQKGEPLTDRRICDLLLQQGTRIARRTVAKYRAELGILPSTMR